MDYTEEVLDRSTGDLTQRSIGEWITVTELGERYGVGPRKVRAVLHHMGLLAPEGQHGSYRLTHDAVARGYGKRIKPKKGKWQFDVLSPEAQRLIAEAWEETLVDLDAERFGEPEVKAAAEALAAFSVHRSEALTTQGEVRWLRFYFPKLANRCMAKVLNVSEQLVGRYVKHQEKQIMELHQPTASSRTVV